MTPGINNKSNIVLENQFFASVLKEVIDFLRTLQG
jgi:hypothetical protein